MSGTPGRFAHRRAVSRPSLPAPGREDHAQHCGWGPSEGVVACFEARRFRTSPVIPGRRNRKRAIQYDQQRYRSRHLIENAFCRIKDFRRIATRYDKLAANFLSAVALVTTLAFWL